MPSLERHRPRFGTRLRPRQARRLIPALALAFSHQPISHAQTRPASVFNDQFLETGGDQGHADLSLFSFGNRVMPGPYRVDVWFNENNVGQSEVRFVAATGAPDAVPCLTRPLLDSWGMNVAAFPAIANAAVDACLDLTATLPDASLSYDGAKQGLSVSVPQEALKRTARGAVGKERWDRGIDVGLLDYQLNLSRSDHHDRYGPDAPNNSTTLFGGLHGGFNVGDWRFRHFSTYNRGQDGQDHWQSIDNNLQRDITAIDSQLLIGDGTTPGNLFDGIQFRGVQLSSDDAMLPDSLQGYAPTIRGVARTNARITVKQNGYLVYSTYVSPGPFVLDDLYPTASSGDLEVTVTEADGQQTRYTQAFASIPTLLRDGAWHYSATAGQYRDGYVQGNAPHPLFAQGTLARGLPGELTAYGGATFADLYQSLLVGVGKNLRHFGALSLDLSQAHAANRGNGTTTNGQSLRVLYAKSFQTSGTSLQLAGYRYSTSGYRTFQEAVQMQQQDDDSLLYNRRSELRLDLNQQLGKWGSLSASARQQSFWGTSNKERLIQIGYSNAYKRLNYNLFYNYNTNLNAPPSRQLSLTLSIPLGDSRANAQYAMNRDGEGRSNLQASVNGTAFDDSRFSYNVTASRTNSQGATASANASASYLSSFGRFDLGRSQGQGYGQTTLGMAGGLLVHSGGLTLSQPLGETMALVEAPKAAGIGFEANPGIRTDGAGRAVLPNLSPYRINRIALVTRDLADTVEVRNAAQELVPTRGAVVRARFDTQIGYRLMMTLTDQDGRPLPFGSRVENETGQEVGIVGPDGQAFVSGAGPSGTLTVKWGHGAAEQCTVSYLLPELAQPPQIRELSSPCR